MKDIYVKFNKPLNGKDIKGESRDAGTGQTHPAPWFEATSWQHFIRQQCGSLSHAPRTTRGTEPALLAAEGHQLLGVAVLAAHAQEARFKPPALQVGVELLLHVGWQRTAGFRPRIPESWIVLLDELVQKRRFRAVACVTRWIDERRRARSPRSGGDGHGCCPCRGRGRSRLCHG